MKRSPLHYLVLSLKGIAMGAADVVPGVSGGTIAFVTQIYEELIDSIKSVDGKALRLLFGGKLKDFWKHINGNFLVAVFTGIFISVFSLAKLIHYLLENHPILVWSFFFGLILASALYIGRTISKWTLTEGMTLAVGAVAAYFITTFTPAQTPEAWWFVFLSGALAICAMILPGISGSFILLLLGKYAFVLAAVTSLDVPVLLTLVAGAVVGIISFAHLLSWLLHHFHNATVALLTGFMAGSLNKVWPWKETVEWMKDRHGEMVPKIQANVGPMSYEQLTGEPSLWGAAVLLAVAGILVIFGVEMVSSRKKKGQTA